MNQRELTVIRLQCPACGRAMPSLDTDVVWGCQSCECAYELEEETLVRRKLIRIAPPATSDTGLLLYLPFWRVMLAARAAGGEHTAAATVAELMSERPAWVRAFAMRGAFHCGDPGQLLSEHGWQEERAAGPVPPCLGARLPSAEAVKLARWLLLNRADRKRDVSGIEIDIALGELHLALLPLALDKESERVQLLHAFGSYRRETLLDLPAILRGHEA